MTLIILFLGGRRKFVQKKGRKIPTIHSVKILSTISYEIVLNLGIFHHTSSESSIAIWCTFDYL